MQSGGFFADDSLTPYMSVLREALADLPESVFVDFLEGPEEYLLYLDLPGATADTIEITATGRRLRIEAGRAMEVPDGFQYLTEARPPQFDVEIPLPHQAAAALTEAHIEMGVLELCVPKKHTETTVSVES